jgi:hypothetical protein
VLFRSCLSGFVGSSVEEALEEFGGVRLSAGLNVSSGQVIVAAIWVLLWL